MSIAEKIGIIAENEQKVYDAGYKAGMAVSGVDDRYDEGYTDGYNQGTADGYNRGNTDGYAQGNIDGKQAQYDAFWDNYQQNGERYNWNSAFFGGGWSDNIYNPKHSFSTVKYCNGMFSQSSITDTLLPIDFTDYYSGTSLFYSCSKLKTIRELKVTSSIVYTNWFWGCTALENITFSGEICNDINFEYCKVLSKSSIEHIIEHLSSAVSGKKFILSKTAVNNAFETSEGAADGSESEEWNNLISDISDNWVIEMY